MKIKNRIFVNRFEFWLELGSCCSMAMDTCRTDWNTMTINELLKRVDLTNFQIPENEAKKKHVKEEWKEEMNITYGTNPNSAYLGPKLWDKTISIPLFTDEDLAAVDVPVAQAEPVLDFEKFIEENTLQHELKRPQDCATPNITVEIAPPPTPRSSSVIVSRPSLIVKRQREEDSSPTNLPPGDNDFLYTESKRARIERERAEKRRRFEEALEFDSSDIALATVPGHNFDPKERSFDIEELRPQPIIRKRKKTLVPEHEKDDKYWEKRLKNNVATKRAREAKRLKENQIALRAAFLEKENKRLKEEMENIKFENSKVAMERDILKQKLAIYEK